MYSAGRVPCGRRVDEAFFAHMEEIDLCWRLKNGGYTLKVVPSSVVYHLGEARCR